jgi:integrase
MKRDPSARELGRLTQRGRYRAGPNLFLQISAWRTKAWIFRYRYNGRPRHMGLGPFPLLSLREAREKAYELRRQLKLDHVDPLEARRAKVAGNKAAAFRTISFKEAAERCIAAHAHTWRGNASREQWEQSLGKYAYMLIGDLPVGAIGKAEVVAVLDAAARAPETQKRLKNRLAIILDFAHARGWRETSENPAEHRRLLPKRSDVQHFEGMAYQEVPTFMAQLRSDDSMWARGLELLVLTGARPGELLGARWQEFDRDAAIWTIPAKRMKGGREHRVPLSPRAVEILSTLPQQGEFVLASRSHATPERRPYLGRHLRRMGRSETAHGFRSAFKTWASERTGFARELIEVALAHTLGGLDEAYRRADMMARRRHLMESWAEYCSKSDTANGVVVPLRA